MLGRRRSCFVVRKALLTHIGVRGDGGDGVEAGGRGDKDKAKELSQVGALARWRR